MIRTQTGNPDQKEGDQRDEIEAEGQPDQHMIVNIGNQDHARKADDSDKNLLSQHGDAVLGRTGTVDHDQSEGQQENDGDDQTIIDHIQIFKIMQRPADGAAAGCRLIFTQKTIPPG